MAVRTNWFLDELEVAAPPVDVETVGKPIVLDGPVSLNRRLIELVNEEGRLWSRGVTCAIKDRPDTACSACPVRPDANDPIAPLCAIGCEQERVATRLAVERARAGQS